MERFLKYPKLIKIHLLYLWNKKNIIVLVLINLLCLIYGLISGSVFIDKTLIDSNRDSYLLSFTNQYFFLLKIIYVSFILFVNISYFGKEYQSYAAYLIWDRKSKTDFNVSKIVSSLIFFLFELLYLMLTFYVILSISPYGKHYAKYIVSFTNLYFIGVLYSLLSSFLLRLSGTYLSSIFVLIFYWISLIESDFENETNVFVKIITTIFPCPTGDYMGFVFDFWILPIYISIVLIMNFSLSFIMDE